MVAKLRYELNPSSLPEAERFIIDDDYLMSHLIDEILLFDNELKTIHNYPKPYDSAIVVLLEEGPLCRWLNLEKHCKWKTKCWLALGTQLVVFVICAKKRMRIRGVGLLDVRVGCFS